MKIKSIIYGGMLLLSVGASTTSCEDMFTAENNLVSTDLAPQDTLYQMMGIVKRMQVLADRTVLLGEVRADLVDVNSTVASADVQELDANNVSTSNAYNKPADYYAVINNCNIYLANVDSLLRTHGEYYYEKEVCAAKCFRAWCYLELAKIYGEVPLVTEPVLTSDAAEQIVSSGSKADMGTILNFCINDLQKYPYMDENNGLRPKYGTQSWNGVSYDNMFIPVRALLAELYMWRGSYTGSQSDYIDAIRMYHDYFCFPDEEHGVNPSSACQDARWLDRNHDIATSSYDNKFDILSNSKTSCLREQAGIIPCDTIAYYGNVSNLRTMFNSQYANNYYPWIVPSSRMDSISKNQIYCLYVYTNASAIDTVYMSSDKNDYTSMTRENTVGDLRYAFNYYSMSNASAAKYNSNYNNQKKFNAKYTEGSTMLTNDKKNSFVPYFRNTILYLHLAEALNQAGFPETAFAILSRGLCYETLNDRSVISQNEYDRLCKIQSYGFTLTEPKFQDNPEMQSKTTGSFVVWPSNVFDIIDKKVSNTTSGISSSSRSLSSSSEASICQEGIHSIGSGDTEYNKYYYLDDAATKANIVAKLAVPDTVKLTSKATAEDSIAWQLSVKERDAVIAENANIDSINAAYLASASVTAKRQAHVSQLILDEEALEGSFEGHRFYDLLRFQMRAGKVSGTGATITLPDYIANKYGKLGNDQMTGKPWYLTLPKR